MLFPLNWANDVAVRRAFTYATRTGIAPAAGSRPIGWYQIHMCHALADLETQARNVLQVSSSETTIEVRYFAKHGVFKARVPNEVTWRRRWTTVAMPCDIYRRADDLSRR